MKTTNIRKNLPSIPGAPGAPEREREKKTLKSLFNRYSSIFLTLITFLSTNTWVSSFTGNKESKTNFISILRTYPFTPTGPGSPLTPGKPASPINYNQFI
jgi:hypothetical protein